mmetsp:Transcript_36945/g.118421  ORF Transcript_36945/g.118421 Transcript_36945/m.118421 type:complete len:464 (+) Transcript_36945:115-1506(+)
MATMVSQPTTSVPAAILKAQSVPPPAVRKSNETFHAVSKKLLSSESSEPRRWQSLKTRGAKLYAWSVAARNDEAAGKKADPRQAALAAAVRMLAYLGGGGETASGSSSSAFDGQRLSSRALREVGIDDIDVPGALASIRKQRNFEEKKAFVKIFHTQKNAAKMTFLSKASAKAAEEFTLVHSSLATDREESPSSSSSSAHHQSDDDDSDDEGLVNEEGATPKMERNVKVVVSMFPETKAVRALHEAVGAGDVRRVEEVAKAYGGSSKSEVAAFATMARALHVAAARDGAFDCPSRGVVDCVATNLGADLLAPDALGYTPLHVAAAIGNSAAVSALLKLARRKNLLEKNGLATVPHGPHAPGSRLGTTTRHARPLRVDPLPRQSLRRPFWKWSSRLKTRPRETLLPVQDITRCLGREEDFRPATAFTSSFIPKAAAAFAAVCPAAAVAGGEEARKSPRAIGRLC